jgi:hypothetical protein
MSKSKVLTIDIDTAAVENADRRLTEPRDFVVNAIADYENGLTTGFKDGVEWLLEQASKTHPAHGLRKIPDWILIKDLSRKVQDLERELNATRKELDESKVVNGDKLHKASIEIQREKMYGKLQAEVQKERRRATQLNKQVVELRLKLNMLEDGVI